MKRIILIAVCSVFLFSLTGCGGEIPSDTELSQIVSDAILSDNEGGYREGECCGEGHKILGTEVSGDQLKVYALTMFGYYGFQNGMFIKVSGSGVIPTVLFFEKNGNDYGLLEIEYPTDGEGYSESIKKLFPLKYRAAALDPGRKFHDELKSQEMKYAEEYLKGIGRDAAIGEFSDLDVVSLTDMGVSVEVSNQLIGDKRLWQYPYWPGETESLEDGIRYIRSLSYDETSGRIKYKTYKYETGEVIETFVFDAVTGKEINQ